MKKILVIVSFALLLASGQNASATLINFDDVSNGTVINTQYSGVTFSCVSCANGGGPDVYARTSATNNSSPNVVSLFSTGFPPFDTNWGKIGATFASPVAYASIDAYSMLSPEGFGTPGQAFLSAYDSSNNLLGSVSNSGYDSWSTLVLSGIGDISYVQFSTNRLQYPAYSLFDNLCFGSSSECGAGGGGNGNGGGSQVPEPGTLLLLGSGLAGMAALRRRFTA